MDKDAKFHSFGDGKSLSTKSPKDDLSATALKQREPLSLSFNSLSPDISGCQFDTKNAVATSNKTKAVIASRRNDFFSDLLLPQTSSISTFSSNSSDSCSQTCTDVRSISGIKFSSTISRSHDSICAVGDGGRIHFGSTSVSSASNATPAASSQIRDIPCGEVSSTLASASSFHPAITEFLSPLVSTGQGMTKSCVTAPLTTFNVLSNVVLEDKLANNTVDSVNRELNTRSGESFRGVFDSLKAQVDNVEISPSSERNARETDAQISLVTGFTLEHSETTVSLRHTRPDLATLDSQQKALQKGDLNRDSRHFSQHEIKGEGIKELESQLVIPSVELVPVCLVEPVRIEMSPCVNGSMRLEPSPERIWGPQVSFLTFSCLDVSRTEVMGHMRQVNSTGCLEAVGTRHHLDGDHQPTKLLASDGDFSCSAQSVSDSEKSGKFEKSLNDENKSGIVSKSFLEFDLGRVVRNGSFCTSKKASAGWSLGWHSPSTRRKRPEPLPVIKPKETWKGKVVRTFRRYGSASVLSTTEHVLQRTKGTFDVPIELCTLSRDNENLPLFVEFCSRIIEERGLENQGIYRVPGNSGSVKLMVEDLNEDPIGLCSESEKWHDVNVVSSLLKLFFRRLPDPLITNELYQPVIAASRLTDPDACLLKLREALHDLPPVNFSTFQFLARHLRRVADLEQVNKMDARNLAIIFGPTLIRPYDNSVVKMVSDMNDQCRVVELIILHCDWFFGDLEEEVEVLRGDWLKESTPVSTMSEELLAKAQQLGEIHGSGHASSSTSSAADRIGEIPDADHKDRIKGCQNPRLSNDSGLVVDTPAIAADDCQREVVFEIKRYPAYHFSDKSSFCTENAKPKVRRTHSNESLGTPGKTADSPLPRRSNARNPQTAFDVSCTQISK